MDMAQMIYERVVTTLVDHLKTAGLTQEELADKCGLTQAAIQRIMTGRRGENLPFRTVLHIALAMEIDLSNLVIPNPPDKTEKIKTMLAEIGKMIANE